MIVATRAILLLCFCISLPTLLVLAAPVDLTRTCFTPSDLTALGLTPPTPRDSSLAPIVFERNGWAGHYISTGLAAQLLKDTMGYSVQIDDTDGLTILESVAVEGAQRVNMEAWPESLSRQTYLDLYSSSDAPGTNAGNLGVIGGSGWYIPSYLLNDPATQNLYFDFWRSYKDPAVLSHFPPAGTTDSSLMIGAGREFIPPICVESTTPPGCNYESTDEGFVSGACKVNYKADCIELLAIEDSYDQGILQQQILNNNLKITVPFLSESNFYAEVLRRYNLHQPFLFYYWEPTPFILSLPFTRVALKQYSTACFSGNTADVNGHGSVDCDFPVQFLMKIYSTSAAANPLLTDALAFIRSFTISTIDQVSLLKQFPDDYTLWDDSAATINCEWLKANANRWKSLVHNPAPQILFLKSISSATQIAIIVIIALGGLFTLGLHTSLLMHPTHSVYVSSSVLFCQLIVGGSWFGYAALLLYPYRSEKGVCITLPILLTLCFTLMVGSLSAKTWRLYAIFSRKTLTVVKITNSSLIKQMLAFVAFDAVIYILWGSIDMPTAHAAKDAVEELGRVWMCDSDHWTVWYLLLLLPKAAVVLGCVYCAYQVRGVSQNFNESKWIGICTYNIAVMAIILFPLLELIGNQIGVRYILISLGILSAILVTLGSLFIPKLMNIHLTGDSDTTMNQTEMATSFNTPTKQTPTATGMNAGKNAEKAISTSVGNAYRQAVSPSAGVSMIDDSSAGATPRNVSSIAAAPRSTNVHNRTLSSPSVNQLMSPSNSTASNNNNALSPPSAMGRRPNSTGQPSSTNDAIITVRSPSPAPSIAIIDSKNQISLLTTVSAAPIERISSPSAASTAPPSGPVIIHHHHNNTRSLPGEVSTPKAGPTELIVQE